MKSCRIVFINIYDFVTNNYGLCPSQSNNWLELVFGLPLVAGRDFRWAGEADRDLDPFPPSLISWL